MNTRQSPPRRQPAAGKDLYGMKETVKDNTSAFVTKQCRRHSGCRRLGAGPVHISIYLALIVEHFDSPKPKREAA